MLGIVELGVVSTCTSQHPANFIMFLPPVSDNSARDVEYIAHNGRTVAYRRIIPNAFKNMSAARQKYLVFSHGNAEDMYSSDYLYRRLSNELGVGICVYDYPGYGLSTGNPHERGCYENHEAVINALMREYYIPKENIFLVGRSIGTGVVVDYITSHAWTTPVMLISPYKSIFSVVTDKPDGSFNAYSLLRAFDRFDSIGKIGRAACPIKIIHGCDDNIIPVHHGRDLYAAMPNKTLRPEWIDGVGHNDIGEYLQSSWFDELFKVSR